MEYTYLTYLNSQINSGSVIILETSLLATIPTAQNPTYARGSINVNWTQLSSIFPKTIAQIWVNLDMYSDLLSSMGAFYKERTKSVCVGKWLSLMSMGITSLLILYFFASSLCVLLSYLFFFFLEWPCDFGNCFKICPIFNEG